MIEKFCSTCGRSFSVSDFSVRCRLCLHNYHAQCWEKAGGCTTFGCAASTSTKDNPDLNYKKCLNCGEKVLSFAEKCRFCRFDFSNSLNKPHEPGTKKRVVAMRKDPVLTVLLNLFFPGAGYMYLGFFKKGLLWFLLVIVLFVFTRNLLAVSAVYLWLMYDSARQAVLFNRGNITGDRVVHRS